MLFLTRKIEFSAAHACRRAGWSEAQNRRVYGACAEGSGHGHDYRCALTVRGRIDVRTGIVVNLVEIKKTLEAVVGALDGTHLNADDPAFRRRTPTTETLALVLWDRLRPRLAGCEMHNICLRESRTRIIEYAGENGMVYVTRRLEFNAAHRLHSPALSEEENAALFGKCNNPNGHGHNYVLEVTVRGEIDERTGMVMAMGDLDRIIGEEVVERYDHKNLNLDLEEFNSVNPTSEEFARAIWNRLAPHFPGTVLYRVRLVETSNNTFEYYGE